MEKTIRRHKFGNIVGALFCLLGLIALIAVLWKAWPNLSSNPNPLSAFGNSLWEEQFSLLPGVQIRLIYFTFLGIAMLVIGASIYAFSRQWFFLPGKTMTLQCPFCRKSWKTSYDRGQILCPHCRHLVHPRLTKR